jgi:hypothetical protein
VKRYLSAQNQFPQSPHRVSGNPGNLENCQIFVFHAFPPFSSAPDILISARGNKWDKPAIVKKMKEKMNPPGK